MEEVLSARLEGIEVNINTGLIKGLTKAAAVLPMPYIDLTQTGIDPTTFFDDLNLPTLDVDFLPTLPPGLPLGSIGDVINVISSIQDILGGDVTALTEGLAVTPPGEAVFGEQGLKVNTGDPDSPVYLDFAEEIIQAKVDYFSGDLAGILQVAGSMAFTKRGGETVTMAKNGETRTVTSLAVGMSKVYGFAGMNSSDGVDGYWGENAEGRVDGSVRNTGAVGLAVEDLNIGAVFMLDTNLSNPGAYFAAQASLVTAEVIGITGLTADIDDLMLDLNQALSGDLSVVDFSQSRYELLDGSEAAGYRIETGDANSPIILNYNERIIRLQGEAEFGLFGLATLDGAVEVKLTDDEFTLFIDADASVGGFLEGKGQALLVANSAGVGAKFALTDVALELGPVALEIETLEFVMNTTGGIVEYDVPLEFQNSRDLPAVIKISNIPPQKDEIADFYLGLAGEGTLSLLSALDLDGSFSILLSENDGEVLSELNVDMTLALPVFEELRATGTLGLVSGNDAGLYGALSLGGAGEDSILIQAAGVFTLAGAFNLRLNTTSTERTVTVIDTAGFGFTQEIVAAQSLFIQGNASLDLAGVLSMAGGARLQIDPSGVDAALDMKIDLGKNLGAIDFVGAAQFTVENGSSTFALYSKASFNFSLAAVQAETTVEIEINTGSQAFLAKDSSGNELATVAADSFRLGLEGSLFMLPFQGTLDGEISFEGDTFEVRINEAKFDFFGVVIVDVSGYIRSDGEFQIDGAVSFGVDLGPIKIRGGLELTLAHDGFAGRLYGSVGLKIDLGFYSKTVTLAGIDASISIFTSVAHASLSVTALGITFSGSETWRLGPDPVIAEMSGSTLNLNVGDRADRRGDLYDDITTESYRLIDNGGGSVTVEGIGHSQTFTGVETIVGNFGDGNDSLLVDPNLSANLNINMGKGDDYVQIETGVTGTLNIDMAEGNDGLNVYGGKGGSVFRSGSGNNHIINNAAQPYYDEDLNLVDFDPVTVFLGDGNNRYIGGAADEIIYVGGGNDDIVTYGGNDRIILEQAGNKKVDAGDGDNRVTVNAGGVHTITLGRGDNVVELNGDGLNTVYAGDGMTQVFINNAAGTYTLVGNDGLDQAWLTIDSAGSPLLVGAGSFALGDLTVNLENDFDMLNVVDLASNATVLRNVSTLNNDWAGSGLSLINDRHAIDVSDFTFTAPEGRLALYGRGLIGTLNTDVAVLTVVNTSTTVHADVTVREADDLAIADYSDFDGREGGLIAANGVIDLRLAGAGSVLTHRSGVIRTVGGHSLTLHADDVDLRAGTGSVQGSGDLTIQSNSEAGGYRLGSAAQSRFGLDYSTRAYDGFLNLSMRDLDALRSGFSTVTIGHQTPDSRMIVGDLKQSTFNAYMVLQTDSDGAAIRNFEGQMQFVVAPTSFDARLRDKTTLKGGFVQVVGDVQATGDIHVGGELLEIRRTNIHGPVGASNSGISADRVYLSVAEQMLHGGWIKAERLVDIIINQTDGDGALQSYSEGPVGLVADRGSVIETYDANSVFRVTANQAVRIGTEVILEANGATIEISAGTGLTVLNAAVLATRGDNSTITLSSTTFLHLDVGSAVTSGAEFVIVDGTQTPVISGLGATLDISTEGELLIGGSVTSAGDMNLRYGDSLRDHEDYFDQILGAKLTENTVAVSDLVINGLNSNNLPAEVLALIRAANLPLDTDAADFGVETVGVFTEFADLSDADRAKVAESLGYSVVTGEPVTLADGEQANGPVFYNPISGQLVTNFSQGPMPTEGDYTLLSGPVYVNWGAAEGLQVLTGFTTGVVPQYQNDAIDWSAATAPGAGTTFEELTDAQQALVLEQTGYEWDLAAETYFNHQMPESERYLDTLTEGLPLDYTVDSIFWGNTLVPAENTPFADLSSEQKAAVANSLRYQVLEGDWYFDPDAAQEQSLVTELVSGLAPDYSNATMWDGAAEPEAGTPWAALDEAQRDAVVRHLGYSEFTGTVFYNASEEATEQWREAFTEGASADYVFADIDWGLYAPSQDTAFADLTAEQQRNVARHLGYDEYSGLVYTRADAPLGSRFALAFSEGAGEDYASSEVTWSESVAVPAADTEFWGLTLAQQQYVAEQLGFETYESTVYFNDANADLPLATSFTLGMDYTNAAVPGLDGPSPTRWIVSDGDNRYLVYGADEGGDGIIDEIEVREVHQLFGQRGFGFLLTGTLTTLADNVDFVVQGSEDTLVRGDINLLGANSNLTLQSDRFTYVASAMDVTGDITLLGGVALDGTRLGGANADNLSVWVDETTRIETQQEGTTLTVIGGKDVHMGGAAVAGGQIGSEGVSWAGPDSRIELEAGWQLMLTNSVLASGDISIRSGLLAGYAADRPTLVVTAAGGIVSRAVTIDGSGTSITLETGGDAQLMGEILAGGTSREDVVSWSNESATLRIQADGQLWLGGTTLNIDNESVEVGGTLRALDRIDLIGGSHSSGIGVRLPGSALVATFGRSSVIAIESVSNVTASAVIAAGAEVTRVRDADSFTLGRLIDSREGNSELLISAEGQLKVGRDLTAGSLLDLRGGLGDASGTNDDPGLLLLSSAQLQTLRPNSQINLRGTGDVELMTPAWNQQVLANGFAEYANGSVTETVRLAMIIDLGTETLTGVVELAAKTRSGGLIELATELEAAIAATEFEIEGADGTRTTDVVQVRLNDNRLLFTSDYGFSLGQVAADSGSSANVSAMLGLEQLASAALGSHTFYAVDASASGSRVNFISEGSQGGEITVAGWVRAHDSINFTSAGDSVAAQDLELTASGRLETLTGDVEFDLGASGVLRGDLVARGADAVITVRAADRLDIHGSIIARSGIVVEAGGAEKSGDVSLVTHGTAEFTVLSSDGFIDIRGANDVLINNVVGELVQNDESDASVPYRLDVSSSYGTLALDAVSGRLFSAVILNVSGQDLELAGVMGTDRSSGSTFGKDVSLTAEASINLSGTHRFGGSVGVVAGSDIQMFLAQLLTQAGQKMSILAQGAITMGTVGNRSGAVVVQSGSALQIEAGQLVMLADDTQLAVADNQSRLLIEAPELSLAGALLAGATYDEIEKTITWTGTSSRLDLRADRSLTMGSEVSGADLRATGDIRLSAGRSAADLGVWQRENSILAVNTAGFDGAVLTPLVGQVPGSIAIQSEGRIQLHSAVTALDNGSTITLQSQSQVLIDGLVSADSDVTVIAGSHSSGVALLVDTLILDEANQYQSGGTLDTASGGTMSLTATGNIVVRGVVGQQDLGQGKISDLSLTSLSGDIQLFRDVDFRDAVVMSARNIDVLAGSRVWATGEDSSIFLQARGALQVEAGSGEELAAIIQADALVHLVADELQVDGRINAGLTGEGDVSIGNADGRILLNAVKALRTQGFMTSDDRIELNAGIDGRWSREVLEGTIAKSQLSGGDVFITGQAVLAAVNDLVVQAGGNVTLDADPVVAEPGSVMVPVYTTRSETYEEVVGYQLVAVDTVQVPIITWETITLEEQTGTELIQVGTDVFTMEVNLGQIGYWNPNAAATTERFREYLVEGIDYFNSDDALQIHGVAFNSAKVIDWSAYGISNLTMTSNYANTLPELDYRNYSDLSADAQSAVLNHLGYKPLYDFSYNNAEVLKTRGVNDPVSEDWTPDWNGLYEAGTAVGQNYSDRLTRSDWKVYAVDVAGWRDRYMLMPEGANDDVERVSFFGESATYDAYVGQFRDLATVKYDQDRSAYVEAGKGTLTSSNANSDKSYNYTLNSEPNYGNAQVYGNDWEGPNPQSQWNDFDDSAARWEVKYAGDGQRQFEILDNRTGSEAVLMGRTPDWNWKSSGKASYGVSDGSGAYLADEGGGYSYYIDAEGNAQVTYNALDAKFGRFVSADQLFLETTANLSLRAGGPVSTSYGKVGYERNGYNSRHYFLDTEGLNWFDHQDRAQSYEQGFRWFYSNSNIVVHLAWPTNSTQSAAVDSLYSGSAWLGIHRMSVGGDFAYTSRSTGYVTSDTGSSGNNSQYLAYNRWSSGEPNNGNRNSTTQSAVQMYGNGTWDDLQNGDKRAGLYEVRPYWNTDRSIYETFKDYLHDWESGWNPIFDLRTNQSFNWTSFAEPVFDFVPVFEEVTYEKEVLDFETRTVWDKQALTQTQSRLVTDVSYLSLDALGGGFAGETLSAANIAIRASGNTTINGVVAAADTLTVAAGQNIVVSGKTAAEAELPSIATLSAGDRLTLQANVNLTVSDAAKLSVTHADGALALTAGRVVNLGSALTQTPGGADSDTRASASDLIAAFTSAGSLSAEAGSELQLSATFHADSTLSLSAGVLSLSPGGSGSINSDVETLLAADDIALSSGVYGGNIILVSNAITASSSLTAEAVAGRMTFDSGSVTTGTLTVTAERNIRFAGNESGSNAINLVTDTLTLVSTGRGDIDLVLAATAELANVSANDGAIRVQAAGALTLTQVRTLSVSNRNSIDIETLGAGNGLTVGQVGTAGRGDVTLRTQAEVLMRTAVQAGDGVTANTLDVRAGGQITLATQVNNLRLTTTEAGDVTLVQTNRAALTLEQVEVRDGHLTLTADRRVVLNQVRLASAERVLDDGQTVANELNVTASGGDIVVDRVEFGRYYENDDGTLAVEQLDPVSKELVRVNISTLAESDSRFIAEGRVLLDAAGAILGGNDASRINLIADHLVATAGTGISGLVTSLNRIDTIVAHTGGVEIIDRDRLEAAAPGLVIGSVQALLGLAEIESQGTLQVLANSVIEADSIRLGSLEGNIRVETPTGFTAFAGTTGSSTTDSLRFTSGIGFAAGNALTSYRFFNAPEFIEYRIGTHFDYQSYDADTDTPPVPGFRFGVSETEFTTLLPGNLESDTIIIQMPRTISITGTLTASERLELISGTNIRIDGNINHRDGSDQAIGTVVMVAQGQLEAVQRLERPGQTDTLSRQPGGDLIIQTESLLADRFELRAKRNVSVDLDNDLTLNGFIGGVSGFQQAENVAITTRGALIAEGAIVAANQTPAAGSGNGLLTIRAGAIAGDTSSVFIGDALDVRSASGVQLNTLVADVLRAEASAEMEGFGAAVAGQLVLNESDDLNLHQVIARDGSIDVTAGGDLLALQVLSFVRGDVASDSQDIFLGSLGNLTVDRVETAVNLGSLKQGGNITLAADEFIKVYRYSDVDIAAGDATTTNLYGYAVELRGGLEASLLVLENNSTLGSALTPYERIKVDFTKATAGGTKLLSDITRSDDSGLERDVFESSNAVASADVSLQQHAQVGEVQQDLIQFADLALETGMVFSLVISQASALPVSLSVTVGEDGVSADWSSILAALASTLESGTNNIAVTVDVRCRCGEQTPDGYRPGWRRLQPGVHR